MAQAIEKMKVRDADQAAAQHRHSQSVESAKAEHRVALDKCKSLVDQPEIRARKALTQNSPRPNRKPNVRWRRTRPPNRDDPRGANAATSGSDRFV
jgi:hypothetical protein